MNLILKKRLRQLAAVVLLATILPFVSFPFMPHFLFVVATDSMSPTIRRGDIVVISGSAVENGSIVVFRNPINEGYEVHRICGTQRVGNHAYYVTKGDAIDQIDSFLIPQENVVGVVSAIVPYIGLYYLIPRLPALLITMSFIVLYVTIAFYENRRRNPEEKPEEKTSRNRKEKNQRTKKPTAKKMGAAALALFLISVLVQPPLMLAGVNLVYPGSQHPATVTTPKIALQNGTAGSSTMGDGGNSATVTISGSYVTVPWWDSNYKYRKQITITNNIASTLNAGYSVKLIVDTASLVTAGKMLLNGNDLRICYWNTTSSTCKELDRDVINMNTASTEIWWKTQKDIAGSETDSNYYMYYGYSSAESPPANRSNIYVFWDDFDDGSISDWTIQSGTWSAATDQYVSGLYSLRATTGSDSWIKPNAIINEADVELEVYMRVAGGEEDWAIAARVQSGASMNWYEINPEGTDWALAKMTNGSWISIATGTPEPNANVWYRVALRIKGTQAQAWVDGSQRVPASEWANIGTEFSSGSIALRTWDIGTGAWYDNVKLRKFVDPEPLTSLGSEFTNLEVNKYLPQSYANLGSTTNDGAPIGNLQSSNNLYVTFNAYASEASWWNSNYQYRKKITVTAGTVAVPSGYSVPFTENTASLITAGKLRSDGRDFRVLYLNGTAWVELDRDVYSGWNTASTVTWFKLQASIAASGSDSNYYVYYGYSGETGTPPANRNNIYDFWDDFNDGSLNPAWTFSQIGGASGSYSESGTVVKLNAISSGDLWGTSDRFLFLSISRSYDVLVESYTSNWGGSHGTWSKMGGVQLRQSLDATSKNRIMSPVYSAVGATNSYRLSTGGSTSEQTTATRPKYCRLTRIGGTSRAWYSTDGVSWIQLGTQVSFSGGLSNPVRLGIHLAGLSSSSHWVEVDWFKVRKYVNPEPTTTIGSEETPSEYTADWYCSFTGVSLSDVAKVTLTFEGQYSDASVTQRLYLYSFTDSAWVLFDTFTTSSTPLTDENRTFDLTVNFLKYVSSGEVRLRVQAVKSTNTQFQCKVDYANLMTTKAYDYVLKISNQVGYVWSIFLAKSSDSNIARLSNVTIWLHNGGGVSTQIQIISGSYTQTSGSPYSLAAGGTDFIAISAVVSAAGTSQIIAYLKAEIPDSGVHAQLQITFQIT